MRLKLLFAMAALGAAIVAFVAPAPAQAKSFPIAAVQIEATLLPDASMRVVEHITYDFDGEFHNGSRFIPAGDYEIVDVRVTDRDRGGGELPITGAPYQLAWQYDAVDERRTFDISYTVLRAAKVGPDVAELYWKFVGDGHPGVGTVRVALAVPGDGRDVLAWAHGPLNGKVEPRGSTVLMSVDGLGSNTFVEGRVAVPSREFSVPPEGDARLPRILSEEERFAEEANARRSRELAAERRRELFRDVLRVVVPFVPLAGWGCFLALWWRFGREHRVAIDVGEYLREPPDDPPAFVIMLRNWGTATAHVLSATIVDLAQRGHLAIEELRVDRRILPDKVDWEFTRRRSDDKLRTFEAAVLDRLFAESPVTTQLAFENWCKHHRTSADRWWDDVRAKASREFKDRHYIEGGKGPIYFANAAAALGVALLGMVAVANLVLVGGVLAIASGLVQLAATVVLRRRTPGGNQRLAEWKAFERFLRDFSQLEEAPVGHLVLWERYLVYAVALGVTAEVARALAAKIPPEVAAQQGFAGWYHGPRGGMGALDSIGSLSEFSSSFGPTIVAAAQPPSSSSSGSGGGGGFSSGGGGGGGGGSIGAS